MQAYNKPYEDFEAELTATTATIKQNTAGAEKIVQDLLKNMLKSLTEAVELNGFINPMNKVYALNKELE